jgi:uncharacterized glyoxalase superfamily protein PhnB
MHKPKDHNAVSPYLLVKDVAKTMDFLKTTFDAKELFRHAEPNGRVRHAEMRIDDSVVMMGERPDREDGGSASVHVYVPDVDACYRRAVSAGATSLSEPRDQPYGDRSAGVKDAEGNLWWIGTHLAKT